MHKIALMTTGLFAVVVRTMLRLEEFHHTSDFTAFGPFAATNLLCNYFSFISLVNVHFCPVLLLGFFVKLIILIFLLLSAMFCQVSHATFLLVMLANCNLLRMILDCRVLLLVFAAFIILFKLFQLLLFVVMI